MSVLGPAFVFPGPPTLTPKFAATLVDGANEWMCMVDDGGEGVVVSAVSGKTLRMKRIKDPTLAASWTATGGWSAPLSHVEVADIAHVFADGYHWLVYSLAYAGNAPFWLICVEEVVDGAGNELFQVRSQTLTGLSSAFSVTAPCRWLVNDPAGLAPTEIPLLDPALYPHYNQMPGNDSYLFAGVFGSEKHTITIGTTTMAAGPLPTFITLSTAALRTGSAARLRAVATPSARQFDSGSSAAMRYFVTTVLGSSVTYRVVATDTLAPFDLTGQIVGEINVYDYDPTFATVADYGMSLVDPAYGFAMGTLQDFSDRSPLVGWAITCRRRDAASGGADDGKIVRYWFRREAVGFSVARSSELEPAQGGNRPHTLRWTAPDGTGYLLTCWSFKDTTTAGQKVLAEQVSW